jgi:hypothetical protein
MYITCGRNRDRQSDQKARHNAGVVVGREPVGEIEHNAGEEPSLGSAEEEPDDAERRRVADAGPLREVTHRTSERGEDAPGNHDPGDPQPRADLFEHDVARHLKDKIAPVEGAHGKAVFGGGKLKVAAHCQRREAGIDAVDISQQVAHDGEGQQAEIDLPHAGFLKHVHVVSRCRRDSRRMPTGHDVACSN